MAQQGKSSLSERKPIKIDDLTQRADEVNTLMFSALRCSGIKWRHASRRATSLIGGVWNDLKQDIWCEMIRQIKTCSPAYCSFSTYIYNQSRWQVCKILSRKAKIKTVSEYVDRLIEFEPEKRIYQREIEGIISSALTCIDARDRKIISMRFGLNGEEGLSLRESGKCLGVSIERVRQLEMRAMNRFKTVIQHRYGSI